MNESFKDLSPVELLDCRAKPLGHAIKNAYDDSDSPDDDLDVIARVSELKERVTVLLGNDSPSFCQAVRDANVMYQSTDQLASDNPWYDRQDTSKGVLQWLATASDAEVMQFALWNTRRQAKFQKQLSSDLPMLQKMALQQTQDLVDINVFPKKALQHVEASIGHYGTILAMDVFESGLESTNGYCNDTKIAMANMYTMPWDVEGMNSDLRMTSFHEYLHGTRSVGAGTFMQGLTTRSEMPFRVFEEPFVTHVTEVVREPRLPQAEIINPYERHHVNTSTYPSERHLLSIICANNAAYIPVDLLSEAYFDQPDSVARRIVEKKMKKFFMENDDRHNDDALYEFVQNYEKQHTVYGGNKNGFIEDYLSQLYKKQGIESIVEDEIVQDDTSMVVLDDMIIFDFNAKAE